MKNIFFYFLMILILCSCRLVYTVIPTPNDDPGMIQNIAGLDKDWDSLQIQLDKFIENNPGIQRIYNKNKVDEGKDRTYSLVCNKDTLMFRVDVGGNDNTSIFLVEFFRLNHLAFSDLDYNRERRAIKRNKAAYDTCQARYRNLFLVPFSEYAKTKIVKNIRLEYRALLLRYKRVI